MRGGRARFRDAEGEDDLLFFSGAERHRGLEGTDRILPPAGRARESGARKGRRGRERAVLPEKAFLVGLVRRGSQADGVESHVRPKAAKELNSAYCVAVNCAWVKPLMKATNAAVPMPPLIFSSVIDSVRVAMWHASPWSDMDGVYPDHHTPSDRHALS